MSELSPPSRGTAKVTKKQIREMQENYEKAAILAGDNTEIEAKEKNSEISELEDKLDDVFGGKTTAYYLGVDIGGSSIKYLLRSSSNKIINSGTKLTSGVQNSEDILKIIYTIIEKVVQEYGKDTIKGIGIGSKGRILSNGIIKSSSFKPLIGLDLPGILENRYGLAVKVINDASLPYYALDSTEKKSKNILCITLGTGIGTSAYLNGKKFGDETFSSQFANTPFKKNTHESYASTNFLMFEAQKNNLNVHTPFELSQLVKVGNHIAKSIFIQYGKNIGEIISKLICELNIHQVYISGGISKSKKFFEKDIQTTIKELCPIIPKIHTLIEDYEIGAYGASKLIEEELTLSNHDIHP